MGILDGDSLSSVIGAAFKGLYATGKLHIVTKDGSGQVVLPETFTDYDCSLQQDRYSAFVRANAGIPDKDSRFLILQSGMTVTPTVDDELTFAGKRWRVRTVDQDPARSYWDCRVTPR